MPAIEIDRPAQALLEPDHGLPAGQRAQLGRVDPLTINFRRAALLAPMISGSTVLPARRQINATTSPTRCGLPPPALNASPAPLPDQQCAPDREVGRGGVLDVQEVALR